MAEVSIQQLSTLWKGKRFGSVVLDYRKQQSRKSIEKSCLDTIDLLPTDLRSEVAGFLQSIDSLYTAPGMWAADLGESLRLITGKFANLAADRSIATTEAQLVSAFEIVVLNFALWTHTDESFHRWVVDSTNGADVSGTDAQTDSVRTSPEPPGGLTADNDATPAAAAPASLLRPGPIPFRWTPPTIAAAVAGLVVLSVFAAYKLGTSQSSAGMTHRQHDRFAQVGMPAKTSDPAYGATITPAAAHVRPGTEDRGPAPRAADQQSWRMNAGLAHALADQKLMPIFDRSVKQATCSDRARANVLRQGRSIVQSYVDPGGKEVARVTVKWQDCSSRAALP